jgi:tRNA wybutosine-synthesizing protein 2
MHLTPYDEIKKKLSKKILSEHIKIIPKKWEKIGDVLILKIPKELDYYKKDIAKIYSKILKCKSVLNDIGGINETYRIPKIELLYGSRNTETMHIENGIKYNLDPRKIMFSSGNMHERIRMSNISNQKEIIVDLFAGIGYFSIPIAVYSKPKKIYSCEINPVSYNYLCQNIVINHVASIITPLLGDNKTTSPSNIADRVIMGYIKDTEKYFSVAFNSLKNKNGIIHYHDIYPNEKFKEKIEKKIIDIEKKYNVKIKDFTFRIVKSYAPGINHYIIDMRVGEK